MRWISVDERMPEETIPVLLFLPDSQDGEITTGYLSVDGDFRDIRWDVEFNPYYVTHWMPLPPPPEPEPEQKVNY
jgi:hypothetical protein